MSPAKRMGLRGSALVLGGATVLSALLCLYAVVMPLTIGETIAHSNDIQNAFIAANRSISAYRARTGRFPDHDQISTASGNNYQVNVIDPAINSFDQCCRDATRQLGTPPRGSYLLEVWRGEWSEYYAPWSGRSTLTFDRNDYAVTGSLVGDVVLSVALLIGLAFGTVRVWRASAASSGS